jgi:hypothetical protein
MKRVTMTAERGGEQRFARAIDVVKLAAYGESTVGLLLPTDTIRPEALDAKAADLGVKILGARVVDDHVLIEAYADSGEMERLGGTLFSVAVVTAKPCAVHGLFIEMMNRALQADTADVAVAGPGL